MKRKRIDIALVLLALLIGSLCAVSTGRWIDSMETGRIEVQKAKLDLVASAGLFELHNKIYQEVGERAWRDQVRPEFLSRITWETVRATGSLVPEPQEVIDWVRHNPEQARQILKDAVHH
jgi:hypothetical protein